GIAGPRPPFHAKLFTAVYQLNHAVVIELHTLRQSADDRLYLFGQSFHRQQHLGLLRTMPELAGVLLHVPQESTDLIAEFSQRLVLSFSQRFGLGFFL